MTRDNLGRNVSAAKSKPIDTGLLSSAEGLSTNYKNLLFASQDSFSNRNLNLSQDQVLLTLETDLSPKFDDLALSSSSKLG